VILCAMAGFFVTERLQRQRMELKAEMQERRIDSQDNKIGVLTDTQNSLARMMERVSTLVEERTSHPGSASVEPKRGKLEMN
jgi:hypothetical protein